MEQVERLGMAAVIVDATFRARVHSAADKLGGVHVVASPTWLPFVERLHVSSVDGPAALVVGPPAAVLRHAQQALRDQHEPEEFAFVMPVAQIAKPWQRVSAWRDDATLDLWQSGWSPVAVDRLLVAGEEATFEFVIGVARTTPVVAIS